MLGIWSTNCIIKWLEIHVFVNQLGLFGVIYLENTFVLLYSYCVSYERYLEVFPNTIFNIGAKNLNISLYF